MIIFIKIKKAKQICLAFKINLFKNYILSTSTMGLLLIRTVFKPAFLNSEANHALFLVDFRVIVIAW